MRATPKVHDRARRRPAPRILLGTVLLLVGCGTGARRNPFRGGESAALTILEVENHHWADMTISVRRGGQFVRLGLVTTNSRQRFQIPATVGGPGISIQFIADPVGSGTVYESPTVALGRDESYVWTLAVNIEHSTLVRR
ncbi:MAG TPA: hypothetical protein VJ997_01525 [Longimicrobiales bacterium]|nr:hypothetical protein [Longimicrobiales bacterium]